MKQIKMLGRLLMVVAMLNLVACGKKGIPPKMDAPPPLPPQEVKSFKVLDYLKRISGLKTIAGQQGQAYWQPMKDVSGKYPGLYGEDFSFAPFFGGKDLAESRMILASDVDKRWKEGQLIALMWHPCPPNMGEPCTFENNVKSKLNDTQWKELVTEGTPLNNAWKARIDAIIPSMQDMQRKGIEILWRPLHEMNQVAFWWGGRPGPEGSAKLFRITRDYIEKVKGIKNLIWVWNLQDFATLASDLQTYDPGPAYYEVISLDVYWSDGTGLTKEKYDAMVAKAGDKPMGLAESDVLYTAGDYAAQPKWTYFMGWRELTQKKNSNQRISDIYNATNIITLDEMPGWK